MTTNREHTLYEAVGGAPVVLALAAAWHERVLADPVVSHAFSHGFHPEHTERLAAYWAQAWGGPAEYSEDESHILRLHAGNGPHEEMDRLAEQNFVAAFDDAGIPADTELRAELLDYWRWVTVRLNSHHGGVDDVRADEPVAVWQRPVAKFGSSSQV